MNRIPLPGDFDFLRKYRLARNPGARDGFGNRGSRGWGAAPEALGIRPWDESATRMAAVASGRLGYPVALELPREVRAELSLLIDQRSCLAFGSASQTVKERIITLGLALALVALHDGWRIDPVVFGDHGFVPLPACGRPEDWLRLHDRLGASAQMEGARQPGCGYSPRPLGLPGFCIYSDADPDSEISKIAGAQLGKTQVLGRIRVFDPWEKSPPLRVNIPLWGPSRKGRENWIDPAGRDQARQDWERRERLWEQASSGRYFSALSHASDQPWETALDPWLLQGGSRSR